MEEKAYYIVDWDEHFETADTKRMKKMSYVKQSINFSHDAVRDLLRADPVRGAAVYGAWRLMISLASQCRPRGVFFKDTGQPHTVDSIADRLCLTPELVDSAISWLMTIGWVSTDESQKFSVKPTEKSCLTVTEPNRKGNGNGKPNRKGPDRASPRDGSARDGSGSDSVGSDGDDDYRTRVKQLLYRIADAPLVARIVNARVGLDLLRVMVQEFAEQRQPANPPAYFLGMLRNRGLLLPTGDVDE